MHLVCTLLNKDTLVPVPRSVPGKTVLTVPVSGSGSVPGPPCFKVFAGDLPKGPLRTKNSTALESVVFCCRRSFSLSVPFSCVFCPENQKSAAEKRGLWEGVVQEPLRRALFCVFLCSEVIFSCKSHRNFFQKLPLQCRHFLENPLTKNPKCS